MIKHPVIFLVSFALLLAAIGFAAQRVIFLQSARRIEGKVISVTGKDSRCGGRRTRYNCTRFEAKVEYTPQETGRTYQIALDAGTTRGHYMPVDHATHRQGQAVKVAYAPDAPDTAYEDTFWGIWGTPLQVMFYQLVAFWASLGESRDRRGYSFS
ncbi:MAG: DUF3592 domain-containing protein [Alphaproteobacteria bacterium]